MSARIGVLGGTFDPIHYGHLAIAEEARVALRLDRVLLVPAGRQPLKHGSHVATPQQRLEMARLACAGNDALEVSPIEVERPGPSYTVSTLEQLRDAGLGTLYFILGADALADLHRWHQAQRIPELAHLVAVARPGHPPDLEALEARLPGVRERLTVLEGPRLEISSTDLRRRVAAGRPIRYLTPDPVVEYIARHRLYRSGSPTDDERADTVTG
ncbi:MAG TPA: nicotinate-nucleotide adenylyltransferase [Roseiflexaceae bacterium]|nr:nicotinate-nucleotide adenylyltransferase [Roseiflexaceae bacterium]